MSLNSLCCDRHGAALIFIHHHKKGYEENLLDKSVGTTGVTSSVRLVLSVLEKKGSTKRIIRKAKSNIFQAKFPDLESIIVDDCVLISPVDRKPVSQIEICKKVLIDLFRGKDMIPAEIVKKLCDDKDISHTTLMRAKADLNIESKKVGRDNWEWIWTFD